MGDGYRQHKQTFEVRISSKHLFIHYCTEVGIHCREEFLEKKKKFRTSIKKRPVSSWSLEILVECL